MRGSHRAQQLAGGLGTLNPDRRPGIVVCGGFCFLEHTRPTRSLALLVYVRCTQVHIPLRTDNEGNAYAASKRSAKKWPCSTLLMELSAQEQKRAVFASLHHIKSLGRPTHSLGLSGFDTQHRISVVDGFTPSWIYRASWLCTCRTSRCRKRLAPPLAGWLARDLSSWAWEEPQASRTHPL